MNGIEKENIAVDTHIYRGQGDLRSSQQKVWGYTDKETARLSHKPPFIFFQNKESGLKTR
jgi:hypothetical protein